MDEITIQGNISQEQQANGNNNNQNQSNVGSSGSESDNEYVVHSRNIPKRRLSFQIQAKVSAPHHRDNRIVKSELII